MYGCCRICGLPIGICKHIRKDIRGSTACVRILSGCGTILVLATAPDCTYGTRHVTKSYCSADM
ncbi:unnamed protein product [Staurois parvus]|uniref:Uncharacterized protein n=1 Tax=Staurois parvus TaxID=386267 RepID=A0ABN9AIA9_9NEOB|nr:unnamed protein product [Staurois parvus]